MRHAIKQKYKNKNANTKIILTQNSHKNTKNNAKTKTKTIFTQNSHTNTKKQKEKQK